MLSLTTPIAIPNLQKIRLYRPADDNDNNVMTFAADVQGPSSRVYATLLVTVRNGECQGVRATVTPVGYTDYAQAFTATVATGYTDVSAAFYGAAGGVAAKLRAAETALVAAGLLPAGTVA